MLSKLSKLIYLIHFHNRIENGQNLTKILQLLDIDWSSGWSIFLFRGNGYSYIVLLARGDEPQA